MKKILTATLISMIMVGMFACGSESEPESSQRTDSFVQSVENEEESDEDTDAATESEPTQAIAVTSTPAVTQAPSTPEPTAATPVPTQAPQDYTKTRTVWVSQTGSKYHSKPNCGRMNASNAFQETEAEAIANGLGKCSKCW